MILRLATFILCVWGIMASAHQPTNLDWSASILIAGIAGPITFLWLLTQRSLADDGWRGMGSWHLPFFPMRRFPFRFWLFTGESMAFGGLSAMASDALNGRGYGAFGGTFLFLGSAIIMASCLAFLRRSIRA